jgi:hypothetical protein
MRDIELSGTQVGGEAIDMHVLVRTIDWHENQ